jgi:hypothetical protein
MCVYNLIRAYSSKFSLVHSSSLFRIPHIYGKIIRTIYLVFDILRDSSIFSRFFEIFKFLVQSFQVISRPFSFTLHTNPRYIQAQLLVSLHSNAQLCTRSAAQISRPLSDAHLCRALPSFHQLHSSAVQSISKSNALLYFQF